MLNLFLGQWKVCELTDKYSRQGIEILLGGLQVTSLEHFELFGVNHSASWNCGELPAMLRQKGFVRDDCLTLTICIFASSIFDL